MAGDLRFKGQKRLSKALSGIGCDECGSKGRRHKNGMSHKGRAPKAKRGGGSVEPERGTQRHPSLKFHRVEAFEDMDAREIAGRNNLDIDEVEVAMRAKTHNEYLMDR